MNQIPLTAVGAERLKEELKNLKFVKRPLVVEAIAVARDHGDLKENASMKMPNIMRHAKNRVSWKVGSPR